jgi:hypothetical protein
MGARLASARRPGASRSDLGLLTRVVGLVNIEATPDRIDLQTGAALSFSIPTESARLAGSARRDRVTLPRGRDRPFVVIAAVVAIHLTVSGLIFLLHPRRFTWPEVTLLRHGTLGWVLLITYLTIGWSRHGADARQAWAGTPCGDVP